MNSIRLNADRLTLRDFTITDLSAVHEYASSEAVVLHQTWGPNSLEDTRNFLASCNAEAQAVMRKNFNLAVVLNEGTLIGGSLAAIRDDGNEAEIGCSFNPRYWGRGYATEALSRLMTFLFDVQSVRRIYATCGPENTASIRLLERVGMNLEGRLRSHKLVRGTWRDSLIWSLLNDDPRERMGQRREEK
jgi:ribosomal-protein-alanine N-acetyltransferase